MHEDEHSAILLEAIDALLRQDISVPQFRDRYYNYYVDELPEWALNDVERNFFGAVQEKLDWVDEEPDTDSRKTGWIDHDEFESWLRLERAAFGRRGNSTL